MPIESDFDIPSGFVILVMGLATSRTCFTWQGRQPRARGQVPGEVWLTGIDQQSILELTGDCPPYDG